MLPIPIIIHSWHGVLKNWVFLKWRFDQLILFKIKKKKELTTLPNTTPTTDICVVLSEIQSPRLGRLNLG